MVDYMAQTRRSPLKSLALYLLSFRLVNKAVVSVLKRLPNSTWRSRIPVIGGVVEISTGPSGAVSFVNTDKCGIARELYWGNGKLSSPADRLALDLAMTLCKNADLFLDIGAYTGLFALAVARRNPTIIAHAYEIVPENYLFLWENILQNNMVVRVEPRLVGVGEKTGTLTVPKSLGRGVLASSVALDSSTKGGVEIPVRSLDDLYKEFSGRMVFKIDVEGFEWSVLQGGSDIISRVRPDMICEILRRAPNIPETQQMLMAHGYNLFHISDDGLRKKTEIVPVKLERDWLFTTRTPDELRSLGFPVSRL